MRRVSLLAIAALLATASAAEAAPTITLHSSATRTLSGHPLALSGRTTGVPGSTTVQLLESPYPYPTPKPAATTTTAADGTFSFAVHPSRDTRYTVTIAGTHATAGLKVLVDPLTFVKVRALPLGRAQVTIVLYHPSDLYWGRAKVHWGFGAWYRGPFTVRVINHAYRLSRHVLVLSAIATLPAGRFHWRVCFTAPGVHALENQGKPLGCAGRGYFGRGVLPVGYPGPAAVARAAAYLATRTGRTAFAVVDSDGRMSGVNIHWTFITASVVKAMLLVGYLRHLAAVGQHTVDSYSNSFLNPMITVSDNNAASQCYSIVGNAGLYDVASAAGMTEFSIGNNWGTALLSPADQARFFFYMDRLIPREFVQYARYLLSNIIAWQSFAIPAVARPLGYRVYFKDGSEPTALGQLVLQIARLEGNGRRIAIAVMTDGDPTMQYGIDTITGVTQALLQ